MKMMNIVGKTFFIIFLFQSLVADVNLGCFEMDGSRIEEISVGAPFLVKVEVNNIDNHLTPDEVPGLDNPEVKYNYEGSSSVITNINGKVNVSKTYSYSVYIEKEGVYEFGPVEIKTKKDSFYSNKASIKVEKSSASFDSAKNYSLSLEVDKESAYVGEEINLKVKLILKEEIKLDALSDMSLEDFDVRAVGSPSKKSEYVNNKKFYVTTWNYKIYPLKSGEIGIPYLRALIKIPATKDSSYPFSHLFVSYVTKRIVSNTLKINVKKTPQGLIAGHFKSFNLDIDKKEFLQNEGGLVKLKLIGVGNFPSIEIANISGLSDNLTTYKSSTKVDSYKDEEEKTFEFVLQAGEPGKYKIPAQTFKYFDTSDKKIKTIRSNSVSFDVLPAAVLDGKDEEDDEAVVESTSVEGLSCQNLSNSKFLDFDIPNWLFILLILLPLLFLLLFKIYILFINTDLYLFLKIKLNYAKAEKSLDYMFVYKSILDFVAKKMNKPKESITVLDLESLFKNSNLYQSWKSYVSTLYLIVFSEKNIKSDVKNSIFKDFKFWLKKIKSLNLVLILFVFFNLSSSQFCDFYNQGIKDYNSQNYVSALVSLQKARKLSNFSNLKKVDEVLEKVKFNLNLQERKRFSSYFKDCLKIFSLGFLKLLVLIFFYLLVLFFIFKKRLYGFLCSFFLILFSLFYFFKVRLENQKIAVVVSSECVSRAGPSSSYHEIFDVSLASSVKVLKESSGWFLIKADKKNGWVEKKCVELI